MNHTLYALRPAAPSHLLYWNHGSFACCRRIPRLFDVEATSRMHHIFFRRKENTAVVLPTWLIPIRPSTLSLFKCRSSRGHIAAEVILGIWIAFNPSRSTKALWRIMVRLLLLLRFANLMVVKDWQPRKASTAICAREVGSRIDSNAVQFPKAQWPIILTVGGRSTVIRSRHR